MNNWKIFYEMRLFEVIGMLINTSLIFVSTSWLGFSKTLRQINQHDVRLTVQLLYEVQLKLISMVVGQ